MKKTIATALLIITCLSCKEPVVSTCFFMQSIETRIEGLSKTNKYTSQMSMTGYEDGRVVVKMVLIENGAILRTDIKLGTVSTRNGEFYWESTNGKNIVRVEKRILYWSAIIDKGRYEFANYETAKLACR